MSAAKVIRLPEDYSRMYIRYNNYVWGDDVTSVCDIPAHRLSVMSCYKYKELARPLVMKYRAEGKKKGDIMRLLKVTEKELRTMGARVGEYR